MDSSHSDSESRAPDSIHLGPSALANTNAPQNDSEPHDDAELKNALLAAFGDDALELLDDDSLADDNLVDDSENDLEPSDLAEDQILPAFNDADAGSELQNNDQHTNASEWASKLALNADDSHRDAWVKQLYQSIYCPTSPGDTPCDSDSTDLDSFRMRQDERILPFSIGNIQLAVSFHDVVEVCRSPKITSLPLAPAWLRGVVNLHGQIMSVTDLRGLVDLDNGQQTIHEKLVVLCDSQSELKTAIIVDHIGGICRSKTTKESAPPNELECVQEISTGWTIIDSRPTALINCQKLFNHQSMAEFVC